MIVPSPHPPVDVPEITLTDYVLRGAEGRSDAPALVDGDTGRELTYGELASAVRRTAAGLEERGLAPGEVVALFAPNLPEYAVPYHGTLAAGGVVTTLNPLSTAPEVEEQLEDSGARFLVTVPPLLGKAREAASGTEVEELLVLGGDGASGGASVSPFSELLAEPGREAPGRGDRGPGEAAVLPYSSGTTGRPKGVVLTHRNLVANIEQMYEVEPLEPGAVLAGVLPFFHSYGMTVIMNGGLRLGATVVTMSRFELEDFLRIVEEHRVTRANLVPPIILALGKEEVVDRYDLSSLEAITSGAAPLGEEVARACAERVGCEVRQGYGLTETSPVTHLVPPGSAEGKLESVGPSLPNTETKIVDPETGEALGPGERGEVWVRGPQVMAGYLERPEATEETLVGDGWLRTGDLGRVDEDGYLYVVDRLKELIKYKGYQVAPAVLEDVLLGHPEVADAAVIPSPDEEAGEVPKAFVVARDELGASEVREFVAERVAPYEKVRAVEFVDEIPKSASGKILRRVLVEREREAAGAPGPHPGGSQ